MTNPISVAKKKIQTFTLAIKLPRIWTSLKDDMIWIHLYTAKTMAMLHIIRIWDDDLIEKWIIYQSKTIRN